MDIRNRQLVNAGDIADAIGVRAATVRKWANEGRIPTIRVSTRTVRFDLTEVLTAIRQSADGGKP